MFGYLSIQRYIRKLREHLSRERGRHNCRRVTAPAKLNAVAVKSLASLGGRLISTSRTAYAIALRNNASTAKPMPVNATAVGSGTPGAGGALRSVTTTLSRAQLTKK